MDMEVGYFLSAGCSIVYDKIGSLTA